jgi:signal transduction histidine kinase
MDVQADVTPRSYEQIILDHLSLGTALLDAKNFRLLKANSLFLALLDKYVSLSWQYGLAIGHQLPEFLPRPRLVELFQQVAEKRKSLEEQKNDFLSIASHELRTPITIIRGYAELLQAKIQERFSLDSPRGRRAIDSIAEQSNRLARMLDAMLDLSHIEKDQLFVHLVPHDLVATLTQFVETQRIVTNTNRFTLNLEGLHQGDALTVCFDEDRIVQLLNNLVSNAIKYSPADGEIEIGLRYCRESPASIVIWVKDVGAGIAERELPHIFERFHRAGNLDRSISGLGIGLYLVNEIAKRHGGRTWAESIEGRGSTFYVQLPLHMIQ